jgi:hypothetical protein
MNKPESFFVVSAWNNDISWIKDYTNDYIIFDKSNTLPEGERIIKVLNYGYNIYDILYFICSFYNDLPELVAFLEGNPFNHCKKEVFDKLIYRKEFTPIEYYADIPIKKGETRDSDGGFEEINNSWYIYHNDIKNRRRCVYASFDIFMHYYFEDYKQLKMVRFAPGAQYIVEKKQILQYPHLFWVCMMNGLNKEDPSEAFVIERALYYIFKGTYKARKEYYDKLQIQIL